MSEALQLVSEHLPQALEKLVAKGDLSSLAAPERLNYYKAVCESLGLNPMTQPFGYIQFRDGGLQLYAKKDATEQLRKINKVSLECLSEEFNEKLKCYIVKVRATDGSGRQDFGTGAVSTANAKPWELPNLIMKAETKAKRRATLSICGLGFLDESELHSVNDAEVVEPDDLPKIKGHPNPFMNEDAPEDETPKSEEGPRDPAEEVPEPPEETEVSEPASEPAPSGTDHLNVTKPQVNKLWEIVRASVDHDEDEARAKMKEYLEVANAQSTAELTRGEYNVICAGVEKGEWPEEWARALAAVPTTGKHGDVDPNKPPF